MRKEFLTRLGGLVIASATVAGCSDSSSDQQSSSATGSGGQSSTGMQSSTGVSTSMGGQSSSGSTVTGSTTGGPVDCDNVSACGGDVVGTWNVTSSCLELSGEMDVSLSSLGCQTVPVSGSLQTTGTLVLNADGTYTDNTTTMGNATITLEAACLSVSSVAVGCNRIGNIFQALGWQTATCDDTTGQCSCALSTEQAGGMGAILPFTEPSSTYTTADNTLTAQNATYSYCAASDTLTVTPEMSALTGTVVLQREGTAGMTSAGGMGGSSTTGMGGSTTGMGGSTTGMGGSTTGMGGSSGSGGTGGTGTTGTGPCDIYEAAGQTCVAAHSTVRALFGAYDGPLYQVKRADGMTQDIPVLSPGGFADSSVQETFCSGSSCTIWRVYDQSGHGNFVEAETPDSTVGGHSGMTAANAAAESLMVGGHKVYSLYTRPSQAYWRDGTDSGTPQGANPQGIYMVTSGVHFNGGCCYDYGTAQVSRDYEGGPTMDSVYFGNCTIWGTGAGDGPWVMADMEDGIVSGSNTSQNPNLTSLPFPYVTAIEKNNGTTEYALKGADATSPALNTYYQGSLPAGKNPMKKGGAIVLGSGGDCCYSNNNASEGTFYEGAIVAGYPSDATDEAVHANVVEAGYGQ